MHATQEDKDKANEHAQRCAQTCRKRENLNYIVRHELAKILLELAFDETWETAQ